MKKNNVSKKNRGRPKKNKIGKHYRVSQQTVQIIKAQSLVRHIPEGDTLDELIEEWLELKVLSQ